MRMPAYFCKFKMFNYHERLLLVLCMGQGKKMLIFLLLIIMTKYTSSNLTNYKWRKETDDFDYIVGISVNETPICTGILIKSNIVLTSVNPLVVYYKIKKNGQALLTDKNIKIHVIYKEWNKNFAVEAIYAYPQFLSCTGAPITEMDVFSKDCPYTPTHDLMTITTKLNMTYNQKPNSELPFRTPFPVNLFVSQRIRINKNEGEFSIAGFGFMDKLHVRRNCELEIVDYLAKHVLVNCDEWLPRHWGYFICILNIENFIGIDSGAPLLYNDIFIGLGSFSLRRGDDSILVFTDIRKYKTLFLNSNGYPIGTIF